MQIRFLNQYLYQVGEIGFDVPFKMTKEQEDKFSEAIIDLFGPNAFVIGTPCTATVTFQIGDKVKKEEFNKKQECSGK